MKLVVLMLSLMMTSAYAKTCFRATNPSQVTIKAFDSSGEGYFKIENAKKVEAILEGKKLSQQGYEIPALFTLNAKSPSMEYSTIAIRFDDTDPNNYGVECDGGKVQLSPTTNGFVVNTDYLRGQIKTEGNDCADDNGMVVMTNVHFEKIACKNSSGL